MGFIIWLIIGGIVGWLASLVMRTDGQQGILLNVVVGIVGAFLGGWIATRFLDRTVDNEDFFDPATWVSAIGGSLVLLIAYRLLFGNSRERR